MLKKIILATAVTASAFTALPAAAEARPNGYSNSRYERAYNGRSYRGRNYYRPARRCSGTTGTIIGGAGGALLGREVAGRGDRTLGTVLGAAAGALLGREVGKSTC